MLLSIIVPAYNEEKRITPFAKELMLFANELSKETKNFEIIFVNDGSTDKTLEIIKEITNEYTKKDKNVKIISHDINKGKADAIKTGVEAAMGDKIIFIDADGSIPPAEIKEMYNKLDQYDIVVGDRALANSKVKQSVIRKITGTAFNSYVRMLFGLEINDNLCGFKGFKKEIAKKLFREIISKRWIFDVELFYRIKQNKYTIYHQPINWINMPGSKIKLIDPLKMAWQLILLRRKLRVEEYKS